LKKKTIYIVAHTHWDREWYFTIEDSNILLVENLKNVMDTLEENQSFSSYSFDAQASIIDEFLKVVPEEKKRLSKLIKEKKIFVGPWYTQTDCLLVNKESIIRNLLYGTRICESFGHSMNVGYLPDTFGQNAYLPSIFKGFDIDYTILKRGIYSDEIKDDVNFNWSSPDGEKIKSNYLILGYSPGEFISDSDEFIDQKFLPLIKKIEKTNKNSDNILFLVGGDQNLIQKNLPEVIKNINSKVDAYEIIISNFEDFMDNSWKNKEFETTLHGELRGTESQRVHRTIGSMRYDIKKANSEVENKIFNTLEPLAIIGEQFQLEYPKSWLDLMWKQLFDAHAHDSIGGCNSDDTNAEVIGRLKKVNRICDGLINLLKKRITFAISKELKKSNIVVLFNTNSKDFSGLKKSILFTKKPTLSLKDIEGNNVPIEIIHQKYIGGGKKIVVSDKGDIEIELPGYYRSEVLIQAKIPSMGWNTLLIEEHSEPLKQNKSIGESISNKDIKIIVENGKINIEKFGNKIEDAFYFEDCGDYGDSYDFSPLEGDTPFKVGLTKIIAVTKNNFNEKIEFLHSLALPKDLEERKSKTTSKILKIYTTFELRKDEKFIRVSHKIDNNIKDHRVRTIFKTSIFNPANSYADSGYTLIPHETISPRMEIWKQNKYVEAPVSIYNMENIALVKDNASLAGVIVEGLKEYEVLEDDKFALTLYRGNGLLGRDNLLWRPNRASGINNTVVKNPDGQLIGELEFDYAIYFDCDIDINNIYDNVENYLERSCSYQNQNLNSFEERLERFSISHLNTSIPASFSLFKIDNQKIYMSSCKKPYKGEGIIVRLYNPSENSEKVNILGKNIKKLIEVKLNEKEIDEIKGIIIGGFGYKTIKIVIN
jgi:2-O-(6-phospho-alpha-D-mannosyl)-D-glycerate hydrolase